MKVLITGGCGYVGSHVALSLMTAGHNVTLIDDLSNSYPSTLLALSELSRLEPEFHQLDIRSVHELRRCLTTADPDVVVHLAGRKHVRQSVTSAWDYYSTNVGGLLALIETMASVDSRRVIFSSSGSIYGETDLIPTPESYRHSPSNPYSMTKSICERILRDLCLSDPQWSVVSLRYFNPAGAHPSGLIGENPVGPPSNLLPVLMEAAAGRRPEGVEVYGTDFPTADGSAVRDYVHVVDVAEAHLRAINITGRQNGFTALNIGRGVGVSVLELIAAVRQTTGRDFPVTMLPRRNGDVSALVGDTTLARSALGMASYRSLDEICQDAWRWECNRVSEAMTTLR